MKTLRGAVVGLEYDESTNLVWADIQFNELVRGGNSKQAIYTDQPKMQVPYHRGEEPKLFSSVKVEVTVVER